MIEHLDDVRTIHSLVANSREHGGVLGLRRVKAEQDGDRRRGKGSFHQASPRGSGKFKGSLFTMTGRVASDFTVSLAFIGNIDGSPWNMNG